MTEALIPISGPTISGLVEARAALLARIDALESERSELLKQVRTLEAGIQIVDPGVRLERRRRTWIAEQPSPNALDEIAAGVLRTMRERRMPMTVPEIVTSLMTQRGVSLEDRSHRSALRQRVGLYLRKQALKSSNLVRRVAGSDERMPRWEIVPIEEIRQRVYRLPQEAAASRMS